MSDRHPQRRGLGRGLGSLIPTGPRPTPPEATTTDQSPAPGTTTLTRPLTADWIGVPLPGDPEGPAHEESAGAEEVTPAAVPESESGRAPGPDAADPSGPATEDLATGEQIAGAADDGNPVGQSGDAADDREAAEQSGDTAENREAAEQSGDTAQDRNPAERSEGADEGGTADAAENSDAGEKSDAAASTTEAPAVDQAAHQAGDGVEVVTPAITTDAVPLHGEALDGITAVASADPVPVTEAPATAAFGRHSAATDASSSNGSTPAAGTTPDAGPTGPALQSVAGAYFAELPVESIRRNPRQPREVFDEEAMAELVQSVLEVGLLQPVVVRPAEDGAFELVMGERRWRACQEAGLDLIPAIVRQTGDDDLLRDALLENLHRAQLNALEEAAAYQQLLEDFGCTHDELATRIGRSRPQISNTIRLLKLSPAVQRRVAAGVLSAGHARALLGVEDPDLQNRLAGRVVAEGISVRALEEIVTVGDVGEPARAKRRARPTAPGVDDLAARLSDRLETRVKVDLGRRKGRITVEFASLPDLERIVGLIDPGHPTRTRQSNPD